MRRNGPHLVISHISFFIIVYLTLFVVRRLLPFYSADHLLFSDALSSGDFNEIRIIHAEEVINKTFINQRIEERDELEIRIVASDRGRGYLTQVVGYLYEAYSSSIPFVSICNVDGKKFKEIDSLIGKIKIHEIGGKKMDRSNLNKMISKETKDYWDCLAIPTRARYIMLLEDDALVIPSFPQLMKSLVDQLDQRKDIDYVKLYHPNHLRKLPSIPMTISASISLTLFLHWFLYGRVHILFLPSTIILYVIIRSFTVQFIADYRYFLSGSAYISTPESCCTPAVVFRTSNKDVMVDELRKEESYLGRAKDHILDESRFIGRQSDMNWVVHIGSYSHVRDKEITLAERLSPWQQNEDKKWLKYFL